MILFNMLFISRVYVQPQWVFDCINENMLLPVADYLPGAILPPHLSPFVEAGDGDYVPPEKQRLIKMKLGLPIEESLTTSNSNEKKDLKNVNETEKEKKSTKISETKKPNAQKEIKGKNGNVKEVKKESEDQNSDDENINDMKVDLDSPEEEEDDEKDEMSDYNSEEEKIVLKKEVYRFFYLNYINFFI